MRSLLICWILMTCLSLAAAAEGWRDLELLVIPGQSVGPIRLGRPLSPEALERLGEPDRRQEADPGYPDSGLVLWTLVPEAYDFDSGILAKLHDGDNPRNVRSVFVAGVRAVTDRGARLGMSLEQVRAIYPEATRRVGRGGEQWSIPGLSFTLSEGRLVEMFVHRAE